MKNFIRKILQRFGYDIIKLNQSSLTALPDFEELHKAVFEKVKDFTMTSPERVLH